jgi:hypothetical protein
MDCDAESADKPPSTIIGHIQASNFRRIAA